MMRSPLTWGVGPELEVPLLHVPHLPRHVEPNVAGRATRPSGWRSSTRTQSAGRPGRFQAILGGQRAQRPLVV
jgi:hypothetical protein